MVGFLTEKWVSPVSLGLGLSTPQPELLTDLGGPVLAVETRRTE